MNSRILTRLKLENYCDIRNLFSSLNHVLAIKASISGNSRGEIFVDSVEEPALAVLWNKRDGFYVGSIQSDIHPQIIRDVIANILEQNKENLDGIDEYVLYSNPSLNDNLCKGLIPSSKVEKRRVKLFTGVETKIVKVVTPVGYELISIEQVVNQGEYFTGLDEILKDIKNTWRSMEHFFQKGLGILLVDQQQNAIASWCFVEHAANNTVELSIETAKTYQRRGFGYLVAQLMLNICHQKALIPHWYCMADNIGSIALARVLNLKERLTFPVWFFKYPG